MSKRIAVLCACFLAGTLLLARNHRAGVVPPREPLATFPYRLGPWTGRDTPSMSDRVREMLDATDLASRYYVAPDGNVIGMYIGFHATGGMHSPMNCLPGAGWNPTRRGTAKIAVRAGDGARRTIEVNRITIVKGIEKQVVLYWYQSCGRTVASEYSGLLYSVVDKMRRGRTDASLVRIVSETRNLGPAAEADSERCAVEFVQLMYPLLSRFVPD